MKLCSKLYSHNSQLTLKTQRRFLCSVQIWVGGQSWRRWRTLTGESFWFSKNWVLSALKSNILVVKSLTTCRCHSVGFWIALFVVSAPNSQSLYFICKVWRFAIFSGSHVVTFFTENKMKWKRNETNISKNTTEFFYLKKIVLLSVFEWKQVCGWHVHVCIV